MPTDNLSGAPETVDDAPLSFDDAQGKLANILTDDPATDPAPKDKGTEHGAASTTAEDDDPLGMNVQAEDVENADPEAEADGPQEDYAGGRFAADNAKVRLDDGTVTSIAELKRGTLFQRDYTQKTQALSEERKSFDVERQTVSQQAQSLNQFRDYALWYAENLLPKPPTPPSDPNDYVGWHEHRQKMDEYNAHAQAYQVFQQQRQQEEAGKSTETQTQATERQRREAALLFKAMPVLKDPVKGKQVWGALVAGAQQHFGLSEAEVNGITDHRILVGLRDAIAYRRLKDAAPKVQERVTQRPAVRSAPRGSTVPVATKERQARSEQLRKSGSLDDAVAVLKTFDL